ncbi:MAG TPA: hypothetical protein VF843_05545 [Streptosporangiaceae bacterium]
MDAVRLPEYRLVVLGTIASMRKGGRGERPRLGVRLVLGAAVRSGRRYWRQILPVAVAVSLATVTVDVVVTDVVGAADLPVAIPLSLLSSVLTLLGAVLLSGFLSQLAGVEHPPGQSPSIRAAARSLAWGRLVGADLLVALIVVVGLIALIIPGLVFLVLLSVTGPAIDLEDRKVLAALRRSAHLVRRHFWTSALLIVVPSVAASLVEGLGPHPDNPAAIVGLLVVRTAAAAPCEAMLGLISVRLFVRLAALDASPATPRGGGQAKAAGHSSGPGAVAVPPRAGPDV